MFPTIENIANNGSRAALNSDRRSLFGTLGGCRPVVGIDVNPRSLANCAAFNNIVMERALQKDIDIVVLGSSWAYFNYPSQSSGSWEVCDLVRNCSPVVSPTGAAELLTKTLSSQIETLQQSGKRVLLVLPFPRYSVDVPKYVSQKLITGMGLSCR